MWVDQYHVVADSLSPQDFIDRRLLLPVDQLSCTLPRNAHDVAPRAAGEQEGAVGHALFQHLNAGNLLFVHMQASGNGGDGPGIQAAGVFIQLPQLLIGVDLHILFRRNHPGLGQEPVSPGQRLLPEAVIVPRLCVVFLQAASDDPALRLRQVGDAHHLAAAPLPGKKLQLPADPDGSRGILPVGDHVPGIQLPWTEWIFPAPDIAGDDVGIGQMLRRQRQRMQIILSCVVTAHNQLHAEVVNEILKPLLEKSHHHINFPNARLVQLADGALNEYLPADFQQGLGILGIYRHHPHSLAGSQNHRAFRSMGPRLRPGQRCRFHGIIQKAPGLQALQAAVHDANTVTAALRQQPLIHKGLFHQRLQDIRFLSIHEFLLLYFREQIGNGMPGKAPGLYCLSSKGPRSSS